VAGAVGAVAAAGGAGTHTSGSRVCSECEAGDTRTVRYIFYYYCDHTTQHTLKLKETLRSPHTGTANAHLQRKRHGPSLIGTTLITEPRASSRSCGSEPVRQELV